MAAAIEDVEDVQTFGERMHVRFADRAPANLVEQVTRALDAAGIRSKAAREVPPSLEDVFIARLAASGREPPAAGGRRMPDARREM